VALDFLLDIHFLNGKVAVDGIRLAGFSWNTLVSRSKASARLVSQPGQL
jgi:hypothetical protein